MPNAASMTSIARSSSQARAWIWPPTMRALRKYSSLCTTTRNTSEAIASGIDTERLITTMTVLAMRLPTMGISPPTKVIATMVLPNGRWMPRSGRMATR